MAERYVVSLTYRDGVNRDSVVQFNSYKSIVEAYIQNPAQLAAKDLADLIGSIDRLTLATRVSTQISRIDTLDTVPPIADTVLRGNRLAISYRANGRQFIITIPARNMSVITQAANSLEVDPNAGEMALFSTEFPLAARSVDGGVPAVTRAYIID